MDTKIESVNTPLNLTTIKADIEEALVQYALKIAAGIKIDSQGKTIILKGKVHSWAERTLVAHEAWTAKGVQAVVDQITIEYD